jgi:hypothetical protein
MSTDVVEKLGQHLADIDPRPNAVPQYSGSRDEIENESKDLGVEVEF